MVGSTRCCLAGVGAVSSSACSSQRLSRACSAERLREIQRFLFIPPSPAVASVLSYFHPFPLQIPLLSRDAVPGAGGGRQGPAVCAAVSHRILTRLPFPGIEMEIVNSCETNNGGCSHMCHHTSSGPVCTCNFGFRLEEDQKSCTGKEQEKATP